MLPVVLVVALAHPAVHAAATVGALQIAYTLAGILAGIGIIAGFLNWSVPKIRKAAKRRSNFYDDWEGEEARPGVPARPGVMERLGTVEFNIETIKHEVHLNSGASIKDIVQRTEEKVDNLHARVNELDKKEST